MRAIIEPFFHGRMREHGLDISLLDIPQRYGIAMEAHGDWSKHGIRNPEISK